MPWLTEREWGSVRCMTESLSAGRNPAGLARVHQTLRVTPAMEAGIVDRVWSIEEIVGLAHSRDYQMSTDREMMEKMVAEALAELGLDYQLQALFEPRNEVYVWCADLFDSSAPKGERAFQVWVQLHQPTGSAYDSVKAELKQKITAHGRELSN
jgi:hypothetical protein